MKYIFKSEIWLYPTETAAWHFVTVPKKESEDIKKKFGVPRRGWGSVPVLVTIGKTTWRTSVFPDKHSGTYILPIKSAVREKEKLRVGRKMSVRLQISG